MLIYLSYWQNNIIKKVAKAQEKWSETDVKYLYYVHYYIAMGFAYLDGIFSALRALEGTLVKQLVGTVH